MDLKTEIIEEMTKSAGKALTAYTMNLHCGSEEELSASLAIMFDLVLQSLTKVNGSEWTLEFLEDIVVIIKRDGDKGGEQVKIKRETIRTH